jgi:vacuolar-type H+-ATPase subunit H
MGMGMMQHMGMGSGMMQSRLGLTQIDPAQVEALKTDLGITPAQETAWAKYSNALHDVATTIKSTRQAAKTAADELLAALDEEQKAKAREILPELATSGSSMMGGMGGGDRNAR